jgi:hypothetical protein
MKITRPITAQPKDWETVDYPRPDIPVRVFVINHSDPLDVYMTMHSSCDAAYRHYQLMQDDTSARQSLRKWNLRDTGPGFFVIFKSGYIYIIQAL